MKRIVCFFKSEILRIIVGAVLFFAGLAFEHIFDFPILSKSFFIAAMVAVGTGVFVDAVRGILRRDLLDEKFLMSVASVGAMIIGDMSEGVAVMLFFLVGEFFEHKAVRTSRASIRALMQIRPDEATVLLDGVEERMDAEDVEVGSVIIVRTGERVPIDSVVIEGTASIDSSLLTGESIPLTADVGCEVESGVVVLNGFIKCRTLRLCDESAASRILELVESASENKAREENFITRFSRVYTPSVVALALVMAILPPLFFASYSWSESIYAALTFLVISCPCALVISVPMAFFGGIGGSAARGILFKGGNVFSSLARANTVVFDKTGTLTTGDFTVGRIECDGVGEDELLYYAASAEYSSTHPIAEAIKKRAVRYSEPESCDERAGRGIVARIDGHTVAVGNYSHLATLGIKTEDISANVYVALDERFIGAIFLTDKIKDEAERAISELSKLGVSRSVMLSGDRRENAERVGAELSISEIEYGLRPEEKYDRLKGIIAESRATIYVGDGINDAPSLAGADVGIAMGGVGSDSAIEAADVVIMGDNLLRIPTAIKAARRTLAIAKANIVFALGVKLAILVLGALGYANMWLAVFADVGVALIAVLNSLRALKIKE